MADKSAEYNPWDGSYSAFIGKGVIVFAALKMATQYLGAWFNSKPVDFKVKYLHDGTIEIADRNFGDSTKEQKLIQDVFNNKTQGFEILFLTRDPYKRFLSAFVQDYIKPLFDNNSRNIHTRLLMEYVFNDVSLYQNVPYKRDTVRDVFLQKYTSMEDSGWLWENDDSEDLSSDMVLFCIQAITRKVLNSGDIGIMTGHNSIYHMRIRNLIDWAPTDNIRLIDIDNQSLSGALNKYEVGIKQMDPIHTTKNLTKRVDDVIKSEPKMYKYILNELHDEQLAYTILNKNFGDKNLK